MTILADAMQLVRNHSTPNCRPAQIRVQQCVYLALCVLLNEEPGRRITVMRVPVVVCPHLPATCGMAVWMERRGIRRARRELSLARRDVQERIAESVRRNNALDSLLRAEMAHYTASPVPLETYEVPAIELLV